MAESCVKFIVLVLTISHYISAQNTGNTVAPNLVMCYNNTALPGITSANSRPPANVNLLVEYLRRIENANPTIGARDLALLIMQQIRQDGITRSEVAVDERVGIPYSASTILRYKFRLLLIDFLPTSELALNLGGLSDFEFCSLHYMISNSIDDLKRDNEAADCSRSSRYTSRVLHRRRRQEDVGEDETEQTDAEPIDDFESIVSARQNMARNISQCPIERGVIYTQSGTVKAGTVLGGIAAGLSQQTVNGTDNRYLATITGEICEALLSQATVNVSLGASGGWNSTINPRYFFLQSNQRLETTDAEIRGALDGLYIAMRMSSLTATVSDLKLSQMIDMYYSTYEKGLLESTLKGCNRNLLYTEITSTAEMTSQLLSVIPVLNRYAFSGASLAPGAFADLANGGISRFEEYLPSLASTDLACSGAATIQRTVTDVLIFVDSSWSYSTVQPVISHILNNIDVNLYQSHYTLYSGSTLNFLTLNESRSLSEFYLQYNESIHLNQTTGFNYISVFETVENYARAKLNNNSLAGGESTIALLIPRTGLTSEETSFLTDRRTSIDRLLPDLNFLVLGTGSASDYSAIVRNTDTDVVILQETTSEDALKTIAQSVVNAIKQIPRSVWNPACTAEHNGAASTFFVTEYVEPLGINYYRIAPNYFHEGGDSRLLTINEQSYGTIQVCISRDNATPDNTTTSDCVTLTAQEQSYDITDYCGGSSLADCQPIYLSVTGQSSLSRCLSTSCRFPDEIQYVITLQNVGCGHGYMISASVLLVLLIGALLQLT